MWTHIDSWVKQQTDSLHLLRMKGSQSCLSYSGYCSSDYAFELGAERKQDSVDCNLRSIEIYWWDFTHCTFKQSKLCGFCFVFIVAFTRNVFKLYFLNMFFPLQVCYHQNLKNTLKTQEGWMCWLYRGAYDCVCVRVLGWGERSLCV